MSAVDGTEALALKRPLSAFEHEKFEDPRDGGAIRERGASRGEQVRLGVDPAEFCGLDQDLEERGDLGPTQGARAGVISSSKNDSPDSTFGLAVVDRNAGLEHLLARSRGKGLGLDVLPPHVARQCANANPGLPRASASYAP